VSAAVKAAVVGATGYAGLELVRLLAAHPRTKAPLVFGRPGDTSATKLSSIYPQIAGTEAAEFDEMLPLDFSQLKSQGVDVLFLATPHEQSREWVPEALAHGVRVIDLSGAWRLNEPANRAVYKFEDEGSESANRLQAQAIYGMPELHREKLAGANLVANPGCYATSIILALAPLVRAGVVNSERGIICDSKSGVSGAGKAPSATTHFMYAAENLSAYGIYAHRHTGELVEQLGVCRECITFTPHLLPIQRGILSTIYVSLKDGVSVAELQKIFCDFYATSPMVRMHRVGQLPQIQHVAHTNFCDIGFAVSPEGRRATVVSCLDNLLKGAAGQAVQNMNVVFGFDEAEGLR
jgi:N-acetyl-gamma-glutamyl-phosphate reductase